MHFSTLFHSYLSTYVSCPHLSYSSLSCPIQSYLILHYLFLLSYFPFLSCTIPTYPFPFSPALSFPLLFFYPVQSYSYLSLPDFYTPLSCPVFVVLSCPIMSYRVLFCPILYYPVLSFFILSYSVQSYSVLSYYILS